MERKKRVYLMRDTHDYLFEKATEGMTAEEVLNYYRNLYHGEPQSTEHGIVASALNEILPRMILPPCKVGDNCYPLPRYKTPIVERKISRITYSKRNVIIGYYENDGQYRPPLRTRILGEDVFLAKEEAEQALKGEPNG